MSDNLLLTPAARPVPRPLYGRVLIEVTAERTDEVKVGDKVLYLDTSYRPLHHVQEFGTVVFPPQRMHEWQTAPCEVRKGDRVRMHYHAICDYNLVEHDGKRYWLVPYEQLYYVERPDGSLHMLSNYCLVEPVWTSGGEEKTAAGLITNLNHTGRARPVANRGVLRHISPSCPLPAGATVAYINDADVPLRVGEEDLYVMDYQRDIQAAL